MKSALLTFQSFVSCANFLRKFEIRSTKFETISNRSCSKFQTSWRVSRYVWNIRNLNFRFVFQFWSHEVDKQPDLHTRRIQRVDDLWQMFGTRKNTHGQERQDQQQTQIPLSSCASCRSVFFRPAGASSIHYEALGNPWLLPIGCGFAALGHPWFYEIFS